MKVDISFEMLEKIIEQNKVTKAVTLSLKGVLYDYVEGNAETLRKCGESRDLVPAATIDPRKYTGAVADVSALADQGFRVLRLFPDLQEWPVRFAPVRSIIHELHHARIPLMVNALTYGVATEMVDMVGEHSFPLILSGIGYWVLSEVIVLMKSARNIFVETSYLDSPDAIEVLVHEVGADRILFGSNTPMTYFRGPYLSVAKADISDQEKEMIFHLNAEKILGDVGK
ncbi:MAG TPA: amidohydrolase family protein [Thermoproteota archaeon]|nr:amidohydrolase family protein [Thermoproteota archaeon]